MHAAALASHDAQCWSSHGTHAPEPLSRKPASHAAHVPLEAEQDAQLLVVPAWQQFPRQ